MNGIPAAGWFEKAAYFLGRREIWRIEGESMFPALRSGATVIVNPHLEIGVGDVILAKHPFKQSIRMAKRVAQITEDGRYFVLGDNALESEDSRAFGAIKPADVIGKITSILDF